MNAGPCGRIVYAQRPNRFVVDADRHRPTRPWRAEIMTLFRLPPARTTVRSDRHDRSTRAIGPPERSASAARQGDQIAKPASHAPGNALTSEHKKPDLVPGCPVRQPRRPPAQTPSPTLRKRRCKPRNRPCRNLPRPVRARPAMTPSPTQPGATAVGNCALQPSQRGSTQSVTEGCRPFSNLRARQHNGRHWAECRRSALRI